MTIEQITDQTIGQTIGQTIIEKSLVSSRGTAKDGILTAEQVDFILRKIADHRSAASRIRQNADMMARAEDNEADNLEWQFGKSLQDFARRELAGSAKKSIRLFHGVLGFRTKQEFFIRT